MANPKEVATILVDGQQFSDWESVWVQVRWNESHPLFRFTAVERDPYPSLWTTQRFNPGQQVAIYLGGLLAVTGVIVTRQVAYDHNNHGVELQGVGVTWAAFRASRIDKTGAFDNKNLQEIADELFAPHGIKVLPIGTVNPRKFEQVQIQPGETIWTFLENLARQRGVIVGSDEKGNALLIDNHTNPVIGALVEGENILKCQAVFTIKDVYSENYVRAQAKGEGTAASELSAKAETQVGVFKLYSPSLTPGEHPVKSVEEVKERAVAETLWRDGTLITVTITVQGWFDPHGALWKAGNNVHVRSPMAILDYIMTIEYATFTQDRNAGTLTVLQLKAPWALKDGSPFHVGDPNAPKPPGEGTADTAPSENPKPVEPSDPPADTLPQE